MRTVLMAAALTAGFGVHAAQAQLTVQLDPKDPKYNTAACKTMRDKAQKFSLLPQDAGTYVFAAVMPGGTVGTMALQHRKSEMLAYQVQQACMTHPPVRKDLDPSATIGR